MYKQVISTAIDHGCTLEYTHVRCNEGINSGLLVVNTSNNEELFDLLISAVSERYKSHKLIEEFMKLRGRGLTYDTSSFCPEFEVYKYKYCESTGMNLVNVASDATKEMYPEYFL